MLEKTERSRLQGKSMSFIRVIKKYQQFNPTLKLKRNKEGSIFMKPQKKAEI